MTDKKTGEELLQDFMLQLDVKLAKQLLLDLDNENIRGPQLYSAIGKWLERHKFQINRFAPEEETVKAARSALDDYDNVVAMEKYA